MQDLMLGMSYFLAGSFIINTFSRSENGFMWAVGIVLIVAGFICLLISLPWKPIQKLRAKYEPNYGKYLYAILFSVVVSEIAIIVVKFHDDTLLLVTGIIFILFLLFSIVMNSAPALFREVRSLITLTITLIGIAIYLLFTVDDKIQLTVVLVLALVALVMALYRVTKRNKPQTPIGRRVGKDRK